jgi:hypothetical protein
MPFMDYTVSLKLDRILLAVLFHPSSWRQEVPTPAARTAARDYLRNVMHQHPRVTQQLAAALEGEIERGLAAEQPTLEAAWPAMLAFFARTGILERDGTPARALMVKMAAATSEGGR